MVTRSSGRQGWYRNGEQQMQQEKLQLQKNSPLAHGIQRESLLHGVTLQGNAQSLQLMKQPERDNKRVMQAEQGHKKRKIQQGDEAIGRLLEVARKDPSSWCNERALSCRGT